MEWNKYKKRNKNDVWLRKLSVGERSETITNPFSGKKVELSPLEVAVYDYIKGAEMLGIHRAVERGRDWFISNNIKAYMALLD